VIKLLQSGIDVSQLQAGSRPERGREDTHPVDVAILIAAYLYALITTLFALLKKIVIETIALPYFPATP
jgi:hypothetical protein